MRRGLAQNPLYGYIYGYTPSKKEIDVLINSNANVVLSVCPLSLRARGVAECGSLSVRSTRRAKDAAEEISAFSECHRCSQLQSAAMVVQNSTHYQFFRIFP